MDHSSLGRRQSCAVTPNVKRAVKVSEDVGRSENAGKSRHDDFSTNKTAKSVAHPITEENGTRKEYECLVR